MPTPPKAPLQKTYTVRDLQTGRTQQVPFDKLTKYQQRGIVGSENRLGGSCHDFTSDGQAIILEEAEQKRHNEFHSIFNRGRRK